MSHDYKSFGNDEPKQTEACRKKAEKNRKEYSEMQELSSDAVTPYFENKLFAYVGSVAELMEKSKVNVVCAPVLPLEEREKMSPEKRGQQLVQDFLRLKASCELLLKAAHVDDQINQLDIGIHGGRHSTSGRFTILRFCDADVKEYQELEAKHQLLHLNPELPEKKELDKKELYSLYKSVDYTLKCKKQYRNRSNFAVAEDPSFNLPFGGAAGVMMSHLVEKYPSMLHEIQKEYSLARTTPDSLAEARNKMIDLEKKEKGLGVMSFACEKYEEGKITNLKFPSSEVRAEYVRRDGNLQEGITFLAYEYFDRTFENVKEVRDLLKEKTPSKKEEKSVEKPLEKTPSEKPGIFALLKKGFGRKGH